jgi:ferrochelatase
MVRELVVERLAPDGVQRRALGTVPTWDQCPAGCCPAPRRG